MTVGEEVVCHPSFLIGMVPYFGSFPSLIDLCNIQVHITAGVHGIPQRLTVSRIISTMEVLLITVVKEGNTSSCHRKNYG